MNNIQEKFEKLMFNGFNNLIVNQNVIDNIRGMINMNLISVNEETYINNSKFQLEFIPGMANILYGISYIKNIDLQRLKEAITNRITILIVVNDSEKDFMLLDDPRIQSITDRCFSFYA